MAYSTPDLQTAVTTAVTSIRAMTAQITAANGAGATLAVEAASQQINAALLHLEAASGAVVVPQGTPAPERRPPTSVGAPPIDPKTGRPFVVEPTKIDPVTRKPYDVGIDPLIGHPVTASAPVGTPVVSGKVDHS